MPTNPPAISTTYPQRLGPFILAAPIGEDAGTADVWLGLMPDGRPCTVKKVAHVAGPLRDANEALFRRRAKIALRLAHDAIATTLAAVEVAGELVIAEEHVNGRDLSAIPRRNMSLDLRVYIVREVARALEYVHDFENLGLVHRDISPANVMVSYDGAVKLIDFGYASAPVHAGLTATGHAFGRTAYAADEVRAGGSADRRADVYALGVVLWELLAARRLWDTLVEEKFVSPSTLPPSRWNSDVPPLLDAVVARAMAEDPDARFQTADQLRHALEPFSPPNGDLRSALAEFMDALDAGAVGRAWVERSLAAARSFQPGAPGPAAGTQERRRHGVDRRSGVATSRSIRIAVMAGAMLTGAGGVWLAYDQPLSGTRSVSVEQAARLAPSPPSVPPPEAPALPSREPHVSSSGAVGEGGSSEEQGTAVRPSRSTNPRDAKAALRRAHELLVAEEWSEAEAQARSATQSSNRELAAKAWAVLGTAQAQQRRVRDARRSLEQARKLAPSDPEIAEALNSLPHPTE